MFLQIYFFIFKFISYLMCVIDIFSDGFIFICYYFLYFKYNNIYHNCYIKIVFKINITMLQHDIRGFVL